MGLPLGRSKMDRAVVLFAATVGTVVGGFVAAKSEPFDEKNLSPVSIAAAEPSVDPNYLANQAIQWRGKAPRRPQPREPGGSVSVRGNVGP